MKRKRETNVEDESSTVNQQQQNPHIETAEQEALNEDRFNVNRELYNHTKFLRYHRVENFVGFSLMSMLADIYVKSLKPGPDCLKRTLYNRIPAIKWIKRYKIKEDLLADLLAGLTVGIMHIPQGMGYSLLASLPPIYGLYTSFYPVIIYWMFGTSRHLSMGTFAVISLMVANVISSLESKYVPPVGFNRTIYNSVKSDDFNQSTFPSNLSLIYDGQVYDPSLFLSDDRERARVMIAAATTFWVGIVQIFMFVFQLGFVSSYLTEPFVNSFLAGCAIHVFTSQIKFIFGIKLTLWTGHSHIPKLYAELINRIGETNLTTLSISLVCIAILLLVKIMINEKYAKKMPVPLPIELVIVILGTTISYFIKLEEKFHVKTIGPIAAGLPQPQVPAIHIVPDLIGHAILIACVSLCINFSLCDLFSKKDKYKINCNQELLAYGNSNLFASFFPCFSSGGSLARSCVQYNAGGRTQLVSVVSCIIIGLVLAFIAPLFKELPQACLASIIVVSLKTLLANLLQLPYYWRVNKIEFMLFLVTFLSVVFLSVEVGLCIGIGFHLVSHMMRSTKPYSTLLGHIPGTEFYKDVKLYKDAQELYRIKVVRVQQELHATNSAPFKKAIYELTRLKPQALLEAKRKLEKKKKQAEQNNKKCHFQFTSLSVLAFLSRDKVHDKKKEEEKSNDVVTETVKPIDDISCTEYEINVRRAELNENADTESKIVNNLFSVINIEDYDYHKNRADVGHNDSMSDQVAEASFDFLIIDCSPINFIDTVGVKTMKQLITDYNEVGVRVYLADCNDSVRERFRKMEQAMPIGSRVKYLDDDIIHLTIHDAVLHALKTRKFEIS